MRSAAAFEFAGHVLDLRNGRLLRSGLDVALRPKSLAVLSCLLQNAGRVLSKDELIRSAWPDVIVSDESLAQCLKDIRKALGPDGIGMIQTLPRRGYLLDAARVRVLDAMNGAAPAGRLGRPSIAVLPFDNLSGELEQGYFADGIAEETIIALSRFRELCVIARNSSFHFRAAALDGPAIAAQLGVEFLISGSVRRAGGRIRVTASLVDAATGSSLWAEHFDREATDIFAIQDEITLMIVTRVLGQARAAVVSRLRSRPTESYSAYDCFLRARALFWSDEAAAQAEPYLLRAIDLDPGFVDALALLSMMHTIGYLHDVEPRRLDDATRLAQQAVSLDPTSPLANHSLGYALTFSGRLKDAEPFFANAIRLNPNEAYFRAEYANWLNYSGRSRKALAEIARALDQDPFANDWFWNVRGNIETAAGLFEQGLASLHRMKIETPWSCCYQAICHTELGDPVSAEACLTRYRAAVPHLAASVYLSRRPFADAATRRRLVDALRRVERGMEGGGGDS